MPLKGAKGLKSSQKASKIPISSAGPPEKTKKPGKSTAQSTPGSSPALTPQPSVPITPEASDNEEDRLPVIQSLVKPCKRQATKEIQKMSDFEVWDYNDGDIIAGTFTHLKSAAYAHFDISVKCIFDEEGDPKEIIYLFTFVEERETELDDVVAEEMDENDDILVDDNGHTRDNQKDLQITRCSMRVFKFMDDFPSCMIFHPNLSRDFSNILGGLVVSNQSIFYWSIIFKIAFNHATAHSLHDQAILLMQNEGVTVSAHELQMAQQIMPQVAGLAHWINDSPKLHEWFKDLVISHPDYADKLGHYQLTNEQWELAEDLAEALELFEEPTQQFSQKGVPLIIDVLPMLLELKLSMQAICDSDTNDDPAHDITHIATQAAILVIDKYTIFTEDCEIYYISIVMYPDHKLQWFKSALGFMTQHVKKIKDMVVEHWKASYAFGGDESQLVDLEPVGKKNQFKVTLKAAKTNYPVDHVLTYIDEPAVPSTDIQAAGGYMKW
ncbi:hypothetical protein D9756_010341 [Leucocoprinus leucothites]|uniref:Uncharacterized protein n=1 Tax=Leucocoprinus leucothites TaxID=201217 RepID=A0A8H5FS40_9AGAR|nr:hypothetical protein D9756_010341 [Leucoagaricus leucothites]